MAKYTHFNAKVTKATWDPKLYHYDLEIEDVQTGEKITDYAEVLINATGWLKYLPLESSQNSFSVLGNGLTSVVFNLSRDTCFTRPIGKTIMTIKGNELPLLGMAQARFKLCQVSSLVSLQRLLAEIRCFEVDKLQQVANMDHPRIWRGYGTTWEWTTIILLGGRERTNERP